MPDRKSKPKLQSAQVCLKCPLFQDCFEATTSATRSKCKACGRPIQIVSIHKGFYGVIRVMDENGFFCIYAKPKKKSSSVKPLTFRCQRCSKP